MERYPLAVISAFALACSVAFAADWSVPSPEGGNNTAAVTALTNALAEAQAGDTVTLAKGTYDLAGFVSHTDATYADSHLYIPGRKILLRGNPACSRDEVVLKGGGSIRILRIKDKSNGIDKAPAFENLTFTNGVSTWWGGAVFLTGNDGDCGYYTNCAFRGCAAIRAGTAWGGTFSRCHFEGNRCTSIYGGCSARAIACDCVFVDNSAVGNGGALNQSVAVRCAFTNNTATVGGGAMSGYSAAYGCIFSGNRSTGTGNDANGGAASGLYAASNCVFVSNSSKRGSCALSMGSGGVVRDCTFRDNHTDDSTTAGALVGGSVYDSSFVENNSGTTGACGNMTVVSNCLFEANRSTGCGALTLVDGGLVQACRFYNNWVEGAGSGALAGHKATNRFVVCDSVFTNNASWSGHGVSDGIAVWSNCTFRANSVRTSAAETTRNAGIANGKVYNCTFRGQFNSTDRIDPRLPCVHDETGVGFHSRSSVAYCELHDCDVNGAIFGGSAERCVFWGITNEYGVVGDATCLTNCLIRDIYTPNCHLFVNKTVETDPQLVNCTVVNCTGRMFLTTNAVAINTLFYNNIDANGKDRMDINCNTDYGVALTNCLYQYRLASRKLNLVDCIQISTTATPKFNKTREPDYPYYMPRRQSPAVNKGLAIDWPEGAVDLGGYPRVIGGRTDIGCYEGAIPPKGTLLLFK